MTIKVFFKSLYHTLIKTLPVEIFKASHMNNALLLYNICLNFDNSIFVNGKQQKMEACWIWIIFSFFSLKTDMIIYTYNKNSCWSRYNIPVYVTSYLLRYVGLLMSIYGKLGSRKSGMAHIFIQATSFNYWYITYRRV